MSTAVATFKEKSEGEVGKLAASVHKLEASEDSSRSDAETVRDQRASLRAKHDSLSKTETGKEVNGRKSFDYSKCTDTLIICGIPLFVFGFRCLFWAIYNMAAVSFSASSNTSNLTVAYIISDGAASIASNVAASITAVAGTYACAGIPACVGMAANTMADVGLPVSVSTLSLVVSCTASSSKTHKTSTGSIGAENYIGLNMAGNIGFSIADIRCMVFIDGPLPPAAPPPPPPDFLDDMNPGNPQHVNHPANNENDEFEENVVEPVLPDSSPHKNPPPSPPDHLDLER